MFGSVLIQERCAQSWPRNSGKNDDDDDLTVFLDESQLRKLNIAYDRELALSRSGKGKEVERGDVRENQYHSHHASSSGGTMDDPSIMDRGGGFMVDEETTAGGFVTGDSYNYSTSYTAYSTESHKDVGSNTSTSTMDPDDAIHVDRVPAVFERLGIPCDKQVMDILHDAIDNHGLVSRQRFIQIASVLFRDSEDTVSDDSIEAKNGKRRQHSRRHPRQGESSMEEEGSESDEESVDEYKPDGDEIDIEDDDASPSPSLSDAEELQTRPQKRKATSVENLPSDYITNKIFNLFKPSAHDGSMERIISIEEMRQVFASLNESGSEDEVRDMLHFS